MSSSNSLPQRAFRILNEEGINTLFRKSTRFLADLIQEPFTQTIFPSTPHYEKIAAKYYLRRYNFDVQNFRAPCNPFKIVYASPKQIKRKTRRGRPTKFKLEAIGTVSDGDWDIRDDFQYSDEYSPEKKQIIDILSNPTGEFEDSILFKSLESHFEKDVAWEDTEYVKIMVDRIQNGERTHRGFKSVEDVLKRCEKLDELYHSINSTGYKTQGEIKGRQDFIQSKIHEISVDIGRNGELLLVNGQHRLSIAKILGLDMIPVFVLVRHKKWMEYRDCVYTKDIDESHPDFREFGY